MSLTNFCQMLLCVLYGVSIGDVAVKGGRGSGVQKVWGNLHSLSTSPTLYLPSEALCKLIQGSGHRSQWAAGWWLRGRGAVGTQCRRRGGVSRRLAGRDCDPGCCWSCAGWHSSYTGPWGRGVCLLQVTAASWGLPGSGTGEGLTLHQATAPSWPQTTASP